MSDVKVSDLTSASALDGTEIVYLVQGGVSKKGVVSDIKTYLQGQAMTWSQAAVFSSTLALAGNFALATNKVTMAAATGDTAIAGTLAVTGAATLGDTLTAGGALRATGANLFASGIGAEAFYSGGTATFQGRNGGTGALIPTVLDGNATYIRHNGADRIVTGALGSDFYGNIDIGGTLDVAGAVVFGDTLTIEDVLLTRTGPAELTTNGSLVVGTTGYVTTSLRIGSLSAPTHTLSVTGTLSASGAAAFGSTLSAAGNVVISGGILALSNGTENRLTFGAVGVGDPAFTTRSIGSKIILYDTIDGTSNGIAIGVGDGGSHMTMNCTQNSDSYGFKWFGGITEVMRLQGDGKLGIGMTPVNELDVSGTFGATGAATLGSTLTVADRLTAGGMLRATGANPFTSGIGAESFFSGGTATFQGRNAATDVLIPTVLDGNGTYIRHNGADRIVTSAAGVDLYAPLYHKQYNMASLPSPAIPGGEIFITDESGGPTLAVSDGSNWRRLRDNVVAS